MRMKTIPNAIANHCHSCIIRSPSYWGIGANLLSLVIQSAVRPHDDGGGGPQVAALDVEVDVLHGFFEGHALLHEVAGKTGAIVDEGMDSLRPTLGVPLPHMGFTCNAGIQSGIFGC